MSGMMNIDEKIKEARWVLADSDIASPIIERCFSVTGRVGLDITLLSGNFFVKT